MENSNKRIIKLLDTIPRFESYSQYNSSLEKVFQDYSFKYLLKHLKEQKKPKLYSYFNVDEKKPETNNIFKAFGLENKVIDTSNNLLNDEEEKMIKIKTDPEENIKKEPIKIPIIKNKRRYNPQLDPFRYSPNYNSIYKNIPSVKIKKPFNETIHMRNFKLRLKNRNKFKNENIEDNDEIERESPFLTEIGDKNYTSIKNLKNYYINKTDNLKKYKKLNLKTEENDRNNHSLKFDQYVDRKNKKIEVNPNISYLEPYDYQKARNNSLDFSKMLSRNEELLLNSNNLKGPSIGYYNPNYNYFNPNIRHISLGNDYLKKEKNRKFLIKKLWASYGVKVDYELVDNNILSKTVLKDLNLEKLK